MNSMRGYKKVSRIFMVDNVVIMETDMDEDDITFASMSHLNSTIGDIFSRIITLYNNLTKLNHIIAFNAYFLYIS